MTAEDILLSKNWSELNSEEKALVKDLATDETAFNQMKQFMVQVGAASSQNYYEPSASVKTRLDNVFASQHAGRLQTAESVKIPAAKVVPIYQRNWTKIAAAAVFVLTAVLVWTWPGRQQIAPATTIAKNEEPVVFSEWNSEAEVDQKEVQAPEKQPAEVSKIDQQLPANAEKDVYDRSVDDGKLGETPVYRSVSTNDQSNTVQYDYGSATSSNVRPAAKAGLTADLFPNNCPNSVGASSEQLLTYIKPAF